jgi:FG-GAP-like repeat
LLPAAGRSIRQSPGTLNGDGKKDVATIVITPDGDASTYNLSVLLSNGNGSFQPAALTAIPGNDNDAHILAGDVNGDGKDDIIVGHSAGGQNETSNFDVLISNGDGTFTLGNNYSITSSLLSGGTLADVNGDGKLDVVVVDQNEPGNVWTTLGNGNQQMSTQLTIATTGLANLKAAAEQ